MLSIYCDVATENLPDSTKEIIYTQSFVSCLSLVENNNPDLIFLHFNYGSTEKNEKQIELCNCLKHDNSRVKNIPIIALLSKPSRKLVSVLKSSGVEYIKSYPNDVDLPDRLSSVLSATSGLTTSAMYYEVICPFINYNLYCMDDEISLCRAHYDRMVISSVRLQKCCLTLQHHQCSNYIEPKIRNEDY